MEKRRDGQTLQRPWQRTDARARLLQPAWPQAPRVKQDSAIPILNTRDHENFYLNRAKCLTNDSKQTILKTRVLLNRVVTFYNILTSFQAWHWIQAPYFIPGFRKAFSWIWRILTLSLTPKCFAVTSRVKINQHEASRGAISVLNKVFGYLCSHVISN